MKTLCMSLRVSLPYLLALGCSIRAGSSISAIGGDGLFADLVVECLALLLVLGLALLLVLGLTLLLVLGLTFLQCTVSKCSALQCLQCEITRSLTCS